MCYLGWHASAWSITSCRRIIEKGGGVGRGKRHAEEDGGGRGRREREGLEG